MTFFSMVFYYPLWGMPRKVKERYMAQISKNARTTSATHHFFCPCGGEVKMKTVFEGGKIKNVAECEKCNRRERRPRDFK